MRTLISTVALLACACAGPVIPPDTSPAPGGERRLLVTLELGQPGRLPAPGSSVRPYAGAESYDVPERTRRLAGRLVRDHGLRQVEDWPIDVLGVH